MATMTLVPPATPAAGPNPCLVNGRSYACAVGSSIDVPDFDAQVLKANGWTILASGGSGTTSQRPINPKLGTVFLDKTLGYAVVYQGNGVWAHHATGASA